jgi:hypothetical protein
MKLTSRVLTLLETCLETWDRDALMEGSQSLIRERAEKDRSIHETYRYTVEKKSGDTMKIRWG